MAKGTKAPAQSTEQIVRDALARAATADAMKLKSAKGADDGLFPNGSAAAVKAAIEQCLSGTPPLLTPAGKQGKDELARLTPAGLLRVLESLDEHAVGPAAARVGRGLPADAALDLANDVIGRVPAAVVELEPLVAEWTAKQQAEAGERAKREADRRERERQAVEAMERYKRSLDTRRTNRIAELKRELAELGGTADSAPPAPRPSERLTPIPAPKDAREFVRQEARRLVSAWVDAIRLGKTEGQHMLEVVLGNLSAMSQIGEEGDEVAFDPAVHEADGNMSRGSPVVVTRPGWELTEGDDARYVVAKARVKPGGG